MSFSHHANKEWLRITENLRERSAARRGVYLARNQAAFARESLRKKTSCANLAHACAASSASEKTAFLENAPNIAIVTAYNDMLSAHQPYAEFPNLIKRAAADFNMTAQVAGGVPAMCDGVTQGEAGMELSLFSRDIIAQSAAVGLSHQMFSGAVYLGTCDKIAPGLLIAALRFAHLPSIFIPSGPMPSGISNLEKVKTREAFEKGEADRAVLLQTEMKAYHAPGTCTFYGTANTNQILLETAGLHLPGATFVAPNSEFRDQLTREGVRVLGSAITEKRPLYELFDEKTVMNMAAVLLATGGSTNLFLHLIAVARAAAILLTLEDFDALSEIIPTIAKIYPNGEADINAFHRAGGVGFILKSLSEAGLLHQDATTILGTDLREYIRPYVYENKKLFRGSAIETSGDLDILRPVNQSFSPVGGLSVLKGEMGCAIVKISAVPEDRRVIEAPARVFSSQKAFRIAFEKGEFTQDTVFVLPGQGPAACGMPELHKLTPILGVLQNRGLRTALLTDGRMSGASGKILAVVHVCPEAARGGLIGKIQDGDLIRIDAITKKITLPDITRISARTVTFQPEKTAEFGVGREFFTLFRRNVSGAETGASIFPDFDD